MADPFSLLAAAIGILDVASKAVINLHYLHDQWRDADLTLLHIRAQLCTFNAALDEIAHWLQSHPRGTHPLSSDLDGAMHCCAQLTQRIEHITAKIASDDDDDHHGSSKCRRRPRLDGMARLRLLRDRKELVFLAQMLDQQTGALNLLLTSLDRRGVCDQQQQQQQGIAIVRRNYSMKTFSAMPKACTSINGDDEEHDDADAPSSLLLQYHRSRSFRSTASSTDNMSMLSRAFDFDVAVLQSRPYAQLLRLSLQHALRMHRGSRGPDITSPLSRSSSFSPSLSSKEPDTVQQASPTPNSSSSSHPRPDDRSVREAALQSLRNRRRSVVVSVKNEWMGRSSDGDPWLHLATRLSLTLKQLSRRRRRYQVVSSIVSMERVAQAVCSDKVYLFFQPAHGPLLMGWRTPALLGRNRRLPLML